MELRPSILFALTAALLSGGCGSNRQAIKAADWIPFSSTEGGFTVVLPGVPIAEAKKTNTAAGPLIRHTFKLVRPEVPDGFTVEYTDFPFNIPPSKADAVLNSVWPKGGSPKHQLQSLKKIQVNGHPGRELTVVKEGIVTPVMRSRVCLVGKRLYSVGVATTRADEASSKVSRFLDSFRLHSPGK